MTNRLWNPFLSSDSRQLTFFLSTLFFMLTGCQTTYTLPIGKPSAEISFESTSDSTGTTGMFISVLHYENLNCDPSKYGDKIAGTSFAEKMEILGPVKILAEESFTFAIRYIDSRIAENRECSVTGSFFPRNGRSYIARFRTVGNVSFCDMTIEELYPNDSQIIDYIYPEFTCTKFMNRPDTLQGKKWATSRLILGCNSPNSPKCEIESPLSLVISPSS